MVWAGDGPEGSGKIMRKRSFLAGTFALLAVLMFSMATVFAAGADFGTGVITAEGYGVAPANARTQGQARALARRAAMVDAYRNLAEQIKGVNLDADTTIENMVTTSDVIHTRTSALIKGARPISEKYNSDGSYQVTVEVSIYGVTDSLASAVLPKNETQEAFPSVSSGAMISSLPFVSDNPTYASSAAPVPYDAQNVKAAGNFTGLIVDCRGLGLVPMMSPVIRNAESQPIYGYKNLNYKKVIAKGMAGYATNMSGASRAGSNPMVVKAVRLEGHNGYPVVATADANRILVENAASGFLDNCNVVFLR